MTLQYDAVVVAVGNYAQPNVPSGVAGMRACPALQMHCHNFRLPRNFAGQTVLVVGASFSGDISLQQPTASRQRRTPFHILEHSVLCRTHRIMHETE